ncbi:MAG: hypothetical protein Q9217_001915 [Psora testacea]
MPFIPHTPESLVCRSDSKNPATTCKGITTEGRHCRRNITSNHSSPTSKTSLRQGVVAVLPAGDHDEDGAAAYFCWQHKDQAERLIRKDQNGRKANIAPVPQRTSIDTLAERLGIIDVADNDIRKKSRRNAKPARKERLPKKWQDVEGPLLAVPGNKNRLSEKVPTQEWAPPEKVHSKLALSLFCCVTPADSNPTPPPRLNKYAEKPLNARNSNVELVQSRKPRASNQASRECRDYTRRATMSPRPIPSNHQNMPSRPCRPTLGQDTSSQTQRFLSLMPQTLSPQITSSLLAELAKSISPLDEMGYIYMYWLTDTAEAPDETTASSLLGTTEQSSPTAHRHGDVLQRYASVENHNGRKPHASTVLLKIGRAANVQRRLNQWTRQCGYNLSLIRYYPYRSSPSSTSNKPSTPSSLPQQVPHAHKVERLIHLELADKRVKRDCESCGKEHKEWFEVEGSRRGLKDVDEIIQRWVAWGQNMPKV